MPLRNDFVNNFRRIQADIHRNAREKGFWEKELAATPTKIALIHTEVSEAMEAWRNGDPVSEKISPCTAFVEELADAVIRIMDLAEGNHLDLGYAIIQKIDYNTTRPRLHGGKRA